MRSPSSWDFSPQGFQGIDTTTSQVKGQHLLVGGFIDDPQPNLIGFPADKSPALIDLKPKELQVRFIVHAQEFSIYSQVVWSIRPSLYSKAQQPGQTHIKDSTNTSQADPFL